MGKKITKDNRATRGQTFIGKVIRVSLQKNAYIEWERKVFVPKYERYARKRTRVAAHIPDGMSVNVNDTVEIKETRKISNTKNFIVTRVMK